MKEKALLIFAKNEVSGKVKTRLAAATGAEAALRVYHELLDYTAGITKKLPVDKFVFCPDYKAANDVWEDRFFQKEIQQGSDLGVRMLQAFRFAFDEGYRQAVLIGTDCPELTGAMVQKAFEALNHADLTIGPAKDGGYYLIGMKQAQAAVFEKINWSTKSVLSETIASANANQLSCFLLETLQDVDEISDLLEFKTRISMYPEAQRSLIHRLLKSLP